MTHLWPKGEPITVASETDGTLRAFEWRGHTNLVTGVVKRWRVDVGWWRQRVWREYFKLYTRTGLLVIIYHDLLTGQWYLQRLYD
jgi:hypothetical protein